jgi:hypothetical protein
MAVLSSDGHRGSGEACARSFFKNLVLGIGFVCIFFYCTLGCRKPLYIFAVCYTKNILPRKKIGKRLSARGFSSQTA